MNQIDLSTKDLSYLTDIFNWNVNAYNLIEYLSADLDEQEETEILESLMGVHKTICEKCLNLMNVIEGAQNE